MRRTTRAKTKDREDNRLPPAAVAGRQALTRSVAEQLWQQLGREADGGHRVKYGATKTVMDNARHLYPQMSRDAVKRFLA